MLVLLLGLGTCIWVYSGQDESQSGSSETQVEAGNDGGFFDCDNTRRRKRGGWLKALVC